MSRRRAPDGLSQLLNLAQDSSFQAAVASAWTAVQPTLTSTAELGQSLKTVQEFATSWREQKAYEGQDLEKHVEALTKSIEEALEKGNNLLIPTEQQADLPMEPIRGTQFEKLMVTALQNRAWPEFTHCMQSPVQESQLLQHWQHLS